MNNYNYVLSESIVSRTNQDGTVIVMNIDEGNTFFKINGVAAEVWNELSQKKDINQIIEKVSNEYNAPKEKIIEDVNGLVEKLLAKNLIKIV